MAWKYKDGKWGEITDDEFMDTAKELALRILNSHEPTRNIPSVFIEAMEESNA